MGRNKAKTISQPQTDKWGAGNGKKPAAAGVGGDISMEQT